MSATELSVIIPTFNRPEVLELCLTSLAASEGVDMGTIEVIVVDDGSSSEVVPAVLERMKEVVPFALVTLRQDNAGQASARNRAMQLARGGLWLFINDDTIATPGMVAAHLAGHAARPEPDAGILGRVVLKPDIPMTAPHSLHFDHMYASIEGRTELEWHHFWTTSLSVKGAFFQQHRITFDAEIRYLHDDVEVGQRLQEHGFRLYYDPDCLGYHDHAITDADLLNNADREAHSLVYWAEKRPDRVRDLARFGYTPVKKPWERVVKYPLLAVAFNVVTIPLWRVFARLAWPATPGASRFLLSQCYAARKRRRVASLLAKAAAVLMLVLMAGCSSDAAAEPDPPPANYTATIKGTDVTFEMIWVPEGNFWIGETEVTWNEYLLYCDFDETGKVQPGVDAVTKPSKPLEDVAPFDRDWGIGRRPAVGMSWNGAKKYCRWLSLNTDTTYRLPTEAEWALACGPLPDDLDAHAWHFKNSGGMTQEVGTKKPNARGIHDMYGNLWEHVSDPWSAAEPERACYRGGAWRSKPQDLALELRLAFEEAWTMLDPNVPPGVWWVPDGDHLGMRVLRPGPKSR